MKKNKFSAPAALDRACRGFSFFGFWQANRAALLAAIAVIAAVVILFIWLARRRRRDVFPEIRSEERAGAAGFGSTQVEAQPSSLASLASVASEAKVSSEAGGVRRSAPSPGIHGKIEVLVGNQPIGSYLITDNPLPPT